jgi:hypothetical protein
MDCGNICELMYKALVYRVVVSEPYIDIAGIYANNVTIVDRNGIGIKHSTTFSGGAIGVDVRTYLYYQVKPTSLTANDYIIPITEDFVVSPRSLDVLWEFGPTPTVGLVYSIYFGNKVAKYKVQSGDTVTNVRDGVKAALDALTWPGGTTASTTSVLSNRLQFTISGDFTYPTIQLGTEKYKKGYFSQYQNRYYILVEAEAASAYPTLPAVAASYAINAVTLLPINTTPEGYLSEPFAQYTYSDSVTDTTTLTEIPAIGNVNPGECVIDYYNQRVWFDSNLNIGEIIKIFQK